MAELMVPQMTRMLENLGGWLDKAAAHAEEKKYDPDSLLTARLAPDQFNLARQVQSACDSIKGLAARLSGTEIPTHEDNETTLEQLKARVQATVDFVRSVDSAAYEGAFERKVSFAWYPGHYLEGQDYYEQFALPNAFFHLTTAYAILRHNGVELGKRDFLGKVDFKEG